MGRRGIRQQSLHAKNLGIRNSVRFSVNRPSCDGVIGGLIGLGQTRFLVLTADPPSKGAVRIYALDRAWVEMDLEWLAARTIPDGASADEGNFAIARG